MLTGRVAPQTLDPSEPCETCGEEPSTCLCGIGESDLDADDFPDDDFDFDDEEELA
ncbi:MAG: hypothetical protein AAB262_00950 [Elusimicrobiota bacterium]